MSFLFLVDLIALILYADLTYVNQTKYHIYTPMFKFVPKSVVRKFGIEKKKDLMAERGFYCVSDKIKIDDGVTFNTIFLVIQSLVVLLSLARPILPSILLSILAPIRFYLTATLYLVYLLFCLHTYRSKRELCVYCVSTLVLTPIQMMLCALNLKTISKVYIMG